MAMRLLFGGGLWLIKLPGLLRLHFSWDPISVVALIFVFQWSCKMVSCDGMQPLSTCFGASKCAQDDALIYYILVRMRYVWDSMFSCILHSFISIGNSLFKRHFIWHDNLKAIFVFLFHPHYHVEVFHKAPDCGYENRNRSGLVYCRVFSKIH